MSSFYQLASDRSSTPCRDVDNIVDLGRTLARSVVLCRGLAGWSAKTEFEGNLGVSDQVSKDEFG
jgi:hypothetical protein